MTKKTADSISLGDIIISKDKTEHLVIIVTHMESSTRLRTIDLSTNEPKTRVWKHSRYYAVNTALSAIIEED